MTEKEREAHGAGQEGRLGGSLNRTGDSEEGDDLGQVGCGDVDMCVNLDLTF